MEEGKNYRYTKQELMLRLFAFHDNYENYGGRLSKFLNEYMRKNREADADNLKQKESLFNSTIEIVLNKVFDGKPPPKINVSIFEATLVGVSKNLNYLAEASSDLCRQKYDELINSEPFSADKLKEGLSGKPRVIERMNSAIGIFSQDGF